MKDYEAIYYKLANTSSITAIVPADRIYHGTRPDIDELPAINFFRITQGNTTFQDTKGLIENPIFQIDCRHNTAHDAMNLARQVSEALQNMKEIVNGFDINICNHQSSGQIFWEDDGKIYIVSLDVRIVFYNSEIS